MSLVARYIGADEVIEAYKSKGKPNFSMWCKSAIVCQYNGDDMDEGAEMIREEIERNVKRQFSHECFLKIHPDNEKNYTLKSPVYYNIVFKSYDSPDFAAASNPAVFNYAMMEKLNEITSRLNAIEEEEEEEPEQEEQQTAISGMLAGINQLIAHPIIEKLIYKFLDSPTMPGDKKLHSLAGIPPEKQQQILSKAIETLLNKGVTLEHFVKLSEMPEKQIQSLLNLL